MAAGYPAEVVFSHFDRFCIGVTHAILRFVTLDAVDGHLCLVAAIALVDLVTAHDGLQVGYQRWWIWKQYENEGTWQYEARGRVAMWWMYMTADNEAH